MATTRCGWFGQALLGGLIGLGCNKPAPTATEMAASAQAEASARAAAKASAAVAEPSWQAMPALGVDETGIQIGSYRVDLTKSSGRLRLGDLVARLPIAGKPVEVQVSSKSSTSDVALLLGELGSKGAPSITVKTDGRGDLPKEIALVPEKRVQNPDGCSIVAMVKEDLSTAVWPMKGDRMGSLHRKGLAGPDLTSTGEALVKDLKLCQSRTAFFAAASTLKWVMAFNIGALILKSDGDKKIDTLVLLSEEPVPGRPVKIGG
jgi:hypothetical protein